MFEGLDAYAGTYEFDEVTGTVTHYATVARFPNWEGTAQVRYAKLVAGILHLSTPPIKSSRAMNGLLACGGAGRMMSASEINRQVQFYETAA